MILVVSLTTTCEMRLVIIISIIILLPIFLLVSIFLFKLSLRKEIVFLVVLPSFLTVIVSNKFFSLIVNHLWIEIILVLLVIYSFSINSVHLTYFFVYFTHFLNSSSIALWSIVRVMDHNDIWFVFKPKFYKLFPLITIIRSIS